MRVLLAALVLSILSFAAGIAGDLSIAAPPSPSVIVRLPPPIPIPADAIRAHPLPPLMISAAHAEPAVAHVRSSSRAHASHFEPIAAREKPEPIQTVEVAKVDLDRAPKNNGDAASEV